MDSDPVQPSTELVTEISTETLISPNRPTKNFDMQSIGLGSPEGQIQERDRDITIKPLKSINNINSTTLTRSKTLPSSPSSSPAIKHATVTSPVFVRTQNISQQVKVIRGEPTLPTLSGGVIRRMSISEGVEEEKENELVKPIFIRSDSLPAFPPLQPLESTAHDQSLSSIADLPSNPKHWLPSQLAIHLSTQLSLHPLLSQDITNFIRQSGLNGRTFLRLKEEELVEIGINQKWTKVLMEAKMKLNQDILSGRIVGFGSTAQQVQNSELSNNSIEIEEEEFRKEDWKKSWRDIKGKKSRGRVMGMARNHENSPSPSISRVGRSDSISSTTSTASIDSNRLEDSMISTPLTSNPSNNSNYTNNSTNSKVIDLFSTSITKPILLQSAAGNSKAKVEKWNSTQQNQFNVNEMEEDQNPTVKSASSSAIAKNGTLAALFGLDIEKKKKKTGTVEENLTEEMLTRRLGNGSIILVKRSQLEELGRRMNEVESQLALALSASPTLGMSPSPSFSHSLYEPSSIGIPQELPPQTILPAGLGTWLLSAFSDQNPILNPNQPMPNSWTSLTGYVMAASVGIGIVAGEVVVKKIFGSGGR